MDTINIAAAISYLLHRTSRKCLAGAWGYQHTGQAVGGMKVHPTYYQMDNITFRSFIDWGTAEAAEAATASVNVNFTALQTPFVPE